MDARIKLLSYSSLLTLHSCPRKFELYRLNSKVSAEESEESSVTFAFGHAVGDGIQRVFQGQSEEEIFWNLFLQWETDLENRDDKRQKNFYLALSAVKKFIHLRSIGFLGEYELVHYNNKPACELDFRVRFPDGFSMRGSVDVVLRNIKSEKITVLELKTTGSGNLNAATYKNSAQGIGYSVVLDSIFPGISSYDVLYLVYQTKSMNFEPFVFPKSYLQRAQWIQELLLDIEWVKKCDELGVYPMRGESCFSFYRECEYYGLCHMSNKALVQEIDHEHVQSKLQEEEDRVYQVELTLADLISAQLDRNTES